MTRELAQWYCPTCGIVADRTPGIAPFCHHNRPTNSAAARTHELPQHHPLHHSHCVCTDTSAGHHDAHCPCYRGE